MTRQEAIRILERLQEPEAWEPQISEDAYTALQMAIDALNDVSDRNVGDTISRQVVLNEIEEWISALYENAHHESASDGKMILNAIKHLPSAQPEPCEDAVSRKAVIRLLHTGYHSKSMIEEVRELPSVQPEKQHGRVFKGIVVEYLSYNTYPEYIGKPYFSIKYTENGQEFIGYGTYSPEVLSEYLKEYFMPSAQLEQCWIPVSEKLPEDSQLVLMTIRRMNEHYNHEPFISVGYISWNQSAWWCAHAGDCKSNDVRVDAWMPLPEPYNGDKPE